jgi:hypothetical protein
MTISSTDKVDETAKKLSLQPKPTKPDSGDHGQTANTQTTVEVTPIPEGVTKLDIPAKSNSALTPTQTEAHQTHTIGGRPVDASHLHVTDTVNAMGIRPIAANNTTHYVGTMNVSGMRPISESTLHISQDSSVMGNRPVASNKIEDIEASIGYLD